MTTVILPFKRAFNMDRILGHFVDHLQTYFAFSLFTVLKRNTKHQKSLFHLVKKTFFPPGTIAATDEIRFNIKMLCSCGICLVL